MKKVADTWKIEELEHLHSAIDFPEYQREPNLWSRDAKQRLIDSIMRQFDVASLYLYCHEEGSIDCVDGRQRIGAIMSFLGKNPEDTSDNGFAFRVLNETYVDEVHPWAALDNRVYSDIESMSEQGDETAKDFVKWFRSYELAIVQLSESAAAEEFNLQFARLNLGMITNSGEKLNAMLGNIRDVCFEDIGRHEFLQHINIPTRRFSREQLASQILAQVFAIETCREEGKEIEYARTRHFDLQGFFKAHSDLSEVQRQWISKVNGVMNLLASAFENFEGLRSRALVLSTVLLAYEREVGSETAASRLADFVKVFATRLRSQVGKGLDVDEEYRYLLNFQRHLTQASVERSAVKERARMLAQEIDYWDEQGQLRGDEEFRIANPGREPGE